VNNLSAKSIGIIVLILATCETHLLAVALTQRSDPSSRFPDRIIASKTVVGYFQKFSWGDYFYAVVKTNRGNINFMLNPPSSKLMQRDEDCFLARHQTAKLAIQYDTIAVIRKIQTDRTSLAKWRRSISPAQLKQCRQLIDRATKSN
jgi:hypothetical protein